MADMELVIKIDEEYYNDICDSETVNNYSVLYALDGIRNGVVLPKGHGQLTDLDELINFTYNTYGINSGKSITKDNEAIIDYIYNKAETIVEADTESEDKE